MQRYHAELIDAGLAPPTSNQRLCAIRALAQEAADNRLVDAELANSVGKVKGMKSDGTRAGVISRLILGSPAVYGDPT